MAAIRQPRRAIQVLDVNGVFAIVATPFAADGSVDVSSLERLVEANIAAGVDGLTVLGVASEAQRLNDRERALVIATAIRATAGRVPLVVGASFDGTHVAVEAAGAAREIGAAAVMVAPPTFASVGPALTRHLQAIAAVGLPLILQDYPPLNGVTMTPSQMAGLAAEVREICCIKLEGPPTPVRISQTRALVDSAMRIVGGSGGLYLLDELRHGSDGTMTGYSFPEDLISVVRAWREHDIERAARDYYRILPLLVHEGQPAIGLAIRKEILRRRGWIANATVRAPGMSLDSVTANGIDEVLREIGAPLPSGAR
jgi:4-hydroxy-tetrahydrodipicolinate synthase